MSLSIHSENIDTEVENDFQSSEGINRVLNKTFLKKRLFIPTLGT